ncbi:RES domain-containing protein [bacterium A37T11]|nr:RES domain-containing protein [bacterium A37T11]
MLLYRIAKTEARSTDLSGMGAYKFGGRWNSAGTYMLYTSENSSLAYLESLMHFEAHLIPPSLYISVLEIPDKPKLIHTLSDKDYPKNWQQIGNRKAQEQGDRWINEKAFLGIKVRSAVNTKEYNYLLNPLFPGYHDLVKVNAVESLPIDSRLIKVNKS